MKAKLTILLSIILYYLICIPVLEAQQIMQIPLEVSSLVYLENSNQLIGQGRLPEESFQINRVYSIDVNTGAFQEQPHMGELLPLTTSSDGQLLYMSTGDTIKVFLVEDLSLVEAFTLDPVVSVNQQNFFISPLDASLFAVQSNSTFALYKDRVQLPNTIEAIPNGTYVFSETKDVIYAKDNLGTGNEFKQLAFDENGFMNTEPSYLFNSSSVKSPLAYLNDRIYCTDGVVIDVSEEEPSYFGRHSIRMNQNILSFVTFSEFTSNVFDAPNNQIIQYTSGANTFAAYFFDLDRLTLSEIRTFPVSAPSPHVARLAPGLNFAYSVNDGMIIIRECTSTLAAPILNPVLQEGVRLCFGIGEEGDFPVLPPDGYNEVFDQDGLRWDSLILKDEGTYTIRVADENGCLSAESDPIVAYRSFPLEKPTIQARGANGLLTNGVVQRCADGKVYFQVIVQNGADHYEWSTGEIATHIEVAEDGPIWVRAITAAGCASESSNTITVVSVNFETPDPPEIIGRDLNTNVCLGNGVFLQAEEGYEAYRWYSDEPLVNILSSNYVSAEDANADYFVQGRNAAGCWSALQGIYVRSSLESALPAPQIIANGTLLNTDANATSYAWYFEGVLIPNSNAPTWQALETGNYQVRIGNGICWSPLSEELFIP